MKIYPQVKQRFCYYHLKINGWFRSGGTHKRRKNIVVFLKMKVEINKNTVRNSEIWCWKSMEKISWTDRVKNEVLQTVKEESNILHTTKERRLTGFVTSCVGTAF
jgi:hypothetical protein